MNQTDKKYEALCLPQTIVSTTGGRVLYCACAMHKNPAFAGGGRCRACERLGGRCR